MVSRDRLHLRQRSVVKVSERERKATSIAWKAGHKWALTLEDRETEPREIERYLVSLAGCPDLHES